MATNHDKMETTTLDDSSSDDTVSIIESDEEKDESMFQEDWDNYKRPTNSDTQIVVRDTFLIMEINRFVPYKIGMNLKFHPLNMPYIQIGRITVAGFVMDVKESSSHIEILIEDGTGALMIRYDLKQYTKDQKARQEILEKYQKYATNINKITFNGRVRCPLSLPEIRPNLNYPEQTPIQKIGILESKWLLETKKGLLGKAIVPSDYIRAHGYCHLDFQFQCSSRLSNEIDFEPLCNAEPLLMAVNVECISEDDYNWHIKKWMHINAKRRYKITEEAN